MYNKLYSGVALLLVCLVFDKFQIEMLTVNNYYFMFILVFVCNLSEKEKVNSLRNAAADFEGTEVYFCDLLLDSNVCFFRVILLDL